MFGYEAFFLVRNSSFSFYSSKLSLEFKLVFRAEFACNLNYAQQPT
jgi:hypothetical protein